MTTRQRYWDRGDGSGGGSGSEESVYECEQQCMAVYLFVLHKHTEFGALKLDKNSFETETKWKSDKELDTDQGFGSLYVFLLLRNGKAKNNKNVFCCRGMRVRVCMLRLGQNRKTKVFEIDKTKK